MLRIGFEPWMKNVLDKDYSENIVARFIAYSSGDTIEAISERDTVQLQTLRRSIRSCNTKICDFLRANRQPVPEDTELCDVCEQREAFVYGRKRKMCVKCHNIIHRIAGRIEMRDSPPTPDTEQAKIKWERHPSEYNLSEIEKQVIQVVYDDTGGVKSEMAKSLGVTRATVYAKMKLHGIK